MSTDKGKLHVLAMDMVEALATGDDDWALATLEGAREDPDTSVEALAVILASGIAAHLGQRHGEHLAEALTLVRAQNSGFGLFLFKAKGSQSLPCRAASSAVAETSTN